MIFCLSVPSMFASQSLAVCFKKVLSCSLLLWIHELTFFRWFIIHYCTYLCPYSLFPSFFFEGFSGTTRYSKALPVYNISQQHWNQPFPWGAWIPFSGARVNLTGSCFQWACVTHEVLGQASENLNFLVDAWLNYEGQFWFAVVKWRIYIQTDVWDEDYSPF